MLDGSNQSFCKIKFLSEKQEARSKSQEARAKILDVTKI